jgi:photosystem II stability/assembly factor-like uncharacterized protein
LLASSVAAASAQTTPSTVPTAAPAAAERPGGRRGARDGGAPQPSPTPPYNRLAFREIGPAVAGGRLSTVVGVADDPKLYYIGTGGGGVWKTVNGGATWTSLFDKYASSIGAIAIDPKNHDVVWVATGEANPRNDVIAGNGVYKTTDGGKTWTNMGLAATKSIASIVIDPRDSDVITVGAFGDIFSDSKDRGVYRSTDGGKTWTNTLYLGPDSGVSELVVDPKNPDVMLAGMWQFRRRPWTFTSGGPNDGLYKSTDGGKTWTKLTGHGLPEGQTGRIGLAIAASDPKRIYALIESKDGILWRSDDGGANWTMISKDTLVDQRFFYFSHVRVDPNNPDHLWGISNELAESTDGGHKFKNATNGVHVDYHDMWIAPNDSKRAIVGEDGGFAITLDGGSNWVFGRNIPIGQIYHVGYDDKTPYSVCVGLQDNNGFCGPSNALNQQGIPDDAWDRPTGGDGMWSWPDPRDPNLVWNDSQQGFLSIYNRATQISRQVKPWQATQTEDFHQDQSKYRFNWDAPVAFDPFDKRVTYFGANVVFATSDRGLTWKPISPDLTTNNKAHQQPSGGPLALDVSSAENTCNILDIEPSTKTLGEIWVGTDDGLVQLTRDGGKHWKNVTPPGVGPDGRAEMIAPSTIVAGTAYAVIDRHYLGDPAPYAFVTHDWGAHWTAIAANLPPLEPARAIRPDTRNPHLVYLGTEGAFYLSYDDGATWQKPALGLPTVPTFDIRIQPRFNDLILATHGRDVYILDDATPIQQLPAAQAAGVMLFPLRTTYAFQSHANDEGLYTRFAGQEPQAGAVITFYQKAPQAKNPSIEILDATGRVIRHIAGTNRIGERDIPAVTNFTGINRVAWDLREDGGVRWDGAAREQYKGPRTGLAVVPGTYTVRMTLDGKTMTQSAVVKPDPRATYTQADYVAAYVFAKKHAKEYSDLDAALNRLDAVVASSKERMPKADAALKAQLAAVHDRALAIRGSITADFENGEDNLQRPGLLREDLQRLQFAGGPPSAAQRDFARRVDATYDARMRTFVAFTQNDVAKTDAALKAAGMPALATSGAKRIDVVGTPPADGGDADTDDDRGDDDRG